MNKKEEDQKVERDIQELEKSIEENLLSLVCLPIKQKVEKNKDVISMISYFNGITEKTEDRRNRIVELAWQSLAFSLTAIGIILSIKLLVFLKMIIIAILLLLLVVSVLKIFEHHRQSIYSYPFIRLKKYSNKWKWFYYGNKFFKDREVKLSPKGFTLEDDLNYLKGLGSFINNYSRETIDSELRDNVIQLFLLQVHNYYKNRFYLRLLAYDKYLKVALFLLIIVSSIALGVICITKPQLWGYLLRWQ